MKRRDLERLTDVLLDAEAWPGERRAAANALREGFGALGGLEEREPTPADVTESVLPCGRALSPLDASRCLVDYERTTRFLRGVAEVVQARRSTRRTGPVELLYAGCGPFAPLALPLATRFTPDELRLTLVDVHQRSLDSVRRIVEALGLEPWVRAALQADASRLQLSGTSSFDVLLVEAMQRGLEKEPQVAIAWNLLRQLPDDAVLVPEAVTVRACLADLGAEVAVPLARDGGPLPERTELGTLFELSAAAIRRWGPYPPRCVACFPAVSVAVPRVLRRGEQAVIATRVRIHGTIALAERESGITFPYVVAGKAPLEPGDELRFRYELEPPGLRIERVPARARPPASVS